MKSRVLTVCSKAEELRREERRSRVRLGELLEGLRPTLSARGKQAPAEATPTLYDTVRHTLFVGIYLSTHGRHACAQVQPP